MTKKLIGTIFKNVPNYLIPAFDLYDLRTFKESFKVEYFDGV